MRGSMPTETHRAIPALEAALEGSGARGHLCSVYESPQEHYAVSIPFVRIGLQRREKCFYIADEGTEAVVRKALEAQGVDAERAAATGALVILTKGEAYLRNGVFDAKRMFAFWREAAEKAKSDGFEGLRATGETDWVVRGAPGLERWIQYESTLDRKLSDSTVLALCQYNRRLFPPEVILGVMRAHPLVIFRASVVRNAMYVSPKELERRHFLDGEVERYFRNAREREAMQRALNARRRELQQTRATLQHAESALRQARLQLQAQEERLQKAHTDFADSAYARNGLAQSRHAEWAALHALLTQREREVMALVTGGLLNKQVASLLGVTEITVKTHRRSVMQKMQAASFAELVVIAEALGTRTGATAGGEKPASRRSG